MAGGIDRRGFLLYALRAACCAVLGVSIVRILRGGRADSDIIQPSHRFTWQIDPEKCKFCDRCSVSCVRRPSAVKAVNDQRKCSFCVACYGHVKNTALSSETIAAAAGAELVCPVNAVVRRNHSGGKDGYFIYTIDDSRCIGCGRCAKLCSEQGSRSMFLIIRPDLCLGCNRCEVAVSCPHGAVERIPKAPADDFKGFYIPGEDGPSYGSKV